jgi:tol-pal system protein YbgF
MIFNYLCFLSVKKEVSLNKKPFLLILCLIAGTFICSCITSLPQKNLQRDVNTLKDKVAAIEENYKNLNLQNLQDAIKKIEDDYKSSIEASLRNQASASSDIDEMRSEFRDVRGEVEEIAHKVEEALTESKGETSDYMLRLRDLELDVAQLKGKLETLENNQKLFTTLFSKGMETVKPTPPLISVIAEEGEDADTAETKEGEEEIKEETEEDIALKDITATEEEDTTKADEKEEEKVEEIIIPPETQAEYDKALEVFKEENFDEAKGLFAEFINKFPGMSLTDNAQFWVAECYYKKKEFDKAILEYDKMITNYPDSDKVPSALLKEGFSFLGLNYMVEAVNVLKKLVKKYPDTNQAEIARRKLKVIE